MGIFGGSYVPGSIDYEAAVDSKEVSDSQSSIVFRLTYVVPRPELERRGGIVFLNTSPPESTQYGGDFGNESFSEDHSRHVIDRNGC